MEELQAVYKIIDDMLATTTERHLVPVGELQNWMLDMRSGLMRLQTALSIDIPVEVPVEETVAV